MSEISTFNICLVTKLFPPSSGGAETYSYELSKRLAENGNNVDIYTQSFPNKTARINLHENITVNRVTTANRLGVFETLYFSYKCRNDIHLSDYDIIHSELRPPSTIFFTPGLKMEDVPIVVLSRGTSYDAARRTSINTPIDIVIKYVLQSSNIILDSIAGRVADKVVANNEHSYQTLKHIYRFNESKLEMVPNGIDINEFNPNASPHPEIDENKFTALFVGRLIPIKGLELVIKAIANCDTEIQLIIAGSGRSRGQLEDLASRLCVQEDVKFLGHVDRTVLPSLYAGSDVLLLPSRYEASPFALFESFACGTPVIGANVGGIPSFIENNENGYLLPRDPNSFSEKLCFLANNEEHCSSLGKSAREKAESLTWEDTAEQLETIYAQLINET